MKIIITGASGFIGRNLIPYLKESISGIEIKTLGKANADLNWESLTVNDIANYDAIVHLAGKAHDTKNTSSPQEYFDINFGLTKKLFDLSLEASVGKFIYVSSVKAAADSVEEILTEDALANPQTPYGKSKLKAEEYIIQNSKFNTQNYYILRPCMVHGPGNKGNLNLLYQFAKRGIPYPLAAFENQRSFLSVENFCFVIKELLTGEIESGIYNMADDESLATTEVVKIIAEVQQKTPSLWHIHPSIIRAVAKLSDIVRLPLNSERLKKLTESYTVSNRKIKRALGINKMPVSAREGLIRTIASFSNHK
ncbi:MAG TPA: NAD-dependent epimerase/dehydratase family protein [Flavipsychrobacter sp.]|nr:NAD-dependent epimerase/dehydratase family protein [Flavipsychrobacter sp.]